MRETAAGRSLASDSAIYLFANIFSAAVPFLLLPFLTRYLSPTEYGHVAIFQGLVSGLAAFVGLSVHGAATRKYYDDHAHPRDMAEFIGTCLQILLLTSTPPLLISLFFGSNLGQLLQLDPVWIRWSVPASAGGFVTSLLLTQWQARRQAIRYGAVQVLQAGTILLLTLALVAGAHYGAAGRIGAQIVSVLLFAGLALIVMSRSGMVSWAWRPDQLKEALAFGLPLIPHVGGMFLLAMADRFFINHALGADKAGVYMVAVQLSMVMAIVIDAINKAYVPWLFERLKRDQPEEKQQIVRYTHTYFLAVLIVAALAFVLGPAVIPLLAGEQYRAAGKVIGWLALGQAFGGMYLMVTNYVFYSRRTGMLSVVTAGSGLLNLLLLAVLVSQLQLVGAALAYAGSMALRFAATWWLAQRRHPMPWLYFLHNKKKVETPHA